MRDTHTFNRHKTNWQDIKVITDPNSDLAVRVQCSDGHRPQYSYAIGRVRDGRFISFIRPQVTTQLGTVTLTPFPVETMARLIGEAEQLIHSQLQQREDDYLLKRQARERRDNRSGGKGGRKGRTYSDETDDRGWK